MWSLRPASAGGVRADATSKGERLRGWLFSRGNIPAKTIVPVFKLFFKKVAKPLLKINLFPGMILVTLLSVASSWLVVLVAPDLS